MTVSLDESKEKTNVHKSFSYTQTYTKFFFFVLLGLRTKNLNTVFVPTFDTEYLCSGGFFSSEKCRFFN